MLIEEAMVTPVFTLKKEDTIKSAIELMHEKNIHHIPITDQRGQLVGVVTDRDIRLAVPSIFYQKEHEEIFEKPLETIMTKEVITAHPLDFVEEASLLFYKHKIGCLPIIREDQIVGILTGTDVLRTFLELTGATQPGSQMEIRIPNRPGMLERIVQRISEHKINILSILIYPDRSSPECKIVVLRIETINTNTVADTLRMDGFDVIWPKGVNL